MGGSLSGHEKNCAFLNMSGKSFATASSVLGIDYGDDGRGLATTDWDGDGDLDFWTTNRTGPRLRLMRNNLSSDARHLSINLQGTTCNRDAIGARVRVKLSGHDDPLIKTLRAGEGYLSQSSKTLHFGLGDSTVESVTVRWPGGDVESFVLPAGSSFRIQQGQSAVNALVDRKGPSALKPSLPADLAERQVTRVPMFDRVPAPRLPVRATRESDPVDAVKTFGEGRPLAITLWASWCQQCNAELSDFQKNAEYFRAAGVTLLAVNMDDRFEDQSDQASDFVLSTEWQEGSHLRTAFGTERLLKRLRTLHELQFGRSMTMPVPMTFLINRSGEVSVIYRGRVSAEQIIGDLKEIDRSATDWATFALPLVGLWNERPKPLDILEVPRSLLEASETHDTFSYVQDHEERLSESNELPTLRAWLAAQLVSAGRGLDGRHQFEKALEAAPDDLTIMNNLAWLAATHRDASVRDGKLAVALAEKAARATKGRNPTLLDTLAAAYAEVGEFKRAGLAIERALTIAHSANETELIAKLNSRLALYKNSTPFRE
ncbi:ASPIC/UnbV domain-containing protein [Planctomycetota bacterium]